jgi:micrococcal nuclease
MSYLSQIRRIYYRTPLRLIINFFLAYFVISYTFLPINFLYPQGYSAEEETIEQPTILEAYVTSVIDGDTISIETDEFEDKVRFIGVDCPELSHPEEKYYAQKALRYTKKNLLYKKVWLEFDVQKRDRHGRLLAYVWLKPPKEFSEDEIRENMFNARLLLDGYAKIYTYPPNVKYVNFFIKFQREAVENKTGLWEEDSFIEESANYYIGNMRTKVFHRPTCEWAQKISKYNRIEFKTKTEAILQGFRACRVCNP